MRRHRDGPFYVRLFPNDVHDPHTPQPGTAAKWETVTKNHYEQSFFAVLEALDVQIGRLVDEVDALGIKEKTLIVFTSDNGPTDWPKYYQEVDHPRDLRDLTLGGNGRSLKEGSMSPSSPGFPARCQRG
ncbi:MAG: sulfatase-like hydrolase/transferase [Verrucomicrobiales bacterium]